MSCPTQQFLETVLPTEGFKGVFTLPNRHLEWFTDFAAMAAYILKADQEGHHVYHACAAFPDEGRREAKRALGARSLWLDIDVGEDKTYTDRQAAENAIRLFVVTSALPVPVVVCSGYGFHLYWPLVEMLDPGRWRELSAGLRAACAQHSLVVDGTRTGDLASILRPVGSHNRKREPRLVTWSGPRGAYKVEQFEGLRDAVKTGRVRELWTTDSVSHAGLSRKVEGGSGRSANAFAFDMQPMRLGQRARRLVPDATTIQTNEPSDAEQVAQRCAQLRTFRDTGSRFSEHHWYASLGVIAFAVDGLAICHEWSSRDDRYNEDQTQRKVDHALEAQSGPSTCARFQDINPQGCKDCAFRGEVTTPLQLGRAAYLARKKAHSGNEVQHEIQSQQPLQKVNGHSHVFARLPESFIWREGGLYFVTEKDDKKPIYDKICNVPIWLKDVQTKEISADKFSYRFALDLPHDGEREILIAAKDFWSSSGMSLVQGAGAIIHDEKMFRKYTREAIDMYNRERPLGRAYEQFGWKEDDMSFLYGNRLYRADSVAQMVGSPEVTTRSQWLAPARGGSLERWQDAANALFTVGCEAQSFALLCSFAAPLMRFHSTDEGGAVVSLVSRDSGTGKSTALAATASVWGLRKGLKLENIDTKVSKGLTLGVLGNLPVVYDEVWMRDPEVIREFITTFTNGSDKQRATRDGEIRHAQASWQTILVTASNTSLTDIIGASQGPEATKWRIMEFDATLPKTIEHRAGDRLKKELEANYGYAGDAYLSYLVQDDVLPWVKQAVEARAERVWKETGWGTPQRFWVRTLASAWVAADLIKRMGLLRFNGERIVQWAIAHLGAVQIGFASSNLPPILVLNEYLNAAIDKTLVVPEAWSPTKRNVVPLLKPMRSLAIRLELDTRTIYVSWGDFKDWLVKRQHSITHITETLVAQEVISQVHRNVTLGAGTEMAAGQVKCFVLNGYHPQMIGGEFLRTVQPDTIANVVPMNKRS